MTSLIHTCVAVAAAALLAAGPALGDNSIPGDQPEHGSIWWSELVTSDAARARDFYGKIAGWVPKVVAAEDPSRGAQPGEAEYTIMMSGGHETAGVMRLEGPDAAGLRLGWMTYIQVPSVDQAAEAAVQHGGRVIRSAFDIPDVARVAILEDPLGAVFGVVTPVR